MNYGTTAYGLLRYGEDAPDQEVIDALKPDLMRYLPTYYYDVKEAEAIQEVSADELGRLYYEVRDLLDQFFVSTATWGLAWWERDLGIEVDETKPLEQRRAVIRSRLRQSGTTTKEMLKNMAAAYSGGEVEIIEYPSEYRFIVKFVGVRGVPPNMRDLRKDIETVKPAHLAFEFEFTYLTWEEAKGYSWNQASQTTWNDFRNLDAPIE